MINSEHSTKTTDEIEISLTDLLFSIWDLRWVVMILITLGGIAGALFSGGSGTSYETGASMIITTRNAGGTYQNGSSSPRSEDIYLSQNLTKTVRLLATSNKVLNMVLEDGEYPDILPESIKNQIKVTAEEGTSFLHLTLVWSNEEEAVSILNRIMECLPDVMMEVMDIGSVSIIDFADHVVPVQGSIPKGIGIGVVAGLLLGCLIGILYYLFVPKVRGKGALEALELDIIGEIPLLTKGKEGLHCFLDETQDIPQFYKEAYGRLAVVFRYLTGQNGQKIIAVTSSIAGEGKSTLAYNLALRLTEGGNKILLLDFDFKKGYLYQLAKAKKPKDGEVRTESRNTENLKDLIEKMYNGIYTIQGFSENDIFQVKNKIFPAIHQLKKEFDYILIDTPPVGVMSDVQQMRELIEGVLFIVREDVVSVNNVSKSMEFLKQTGIPITGCILNGGKHFPEYPDLGV